MIDVIIPPSIPMIIYGIAAQQSVPLLFLAGFVPGILIGIALAIYVILRAREEHPDQGAARLATTSADRSGFGLVVFAPVVILGGIYGGLFTPTEAAGVACIYAIVVSLFIYREITLARPLGDHRGIRRCSARRC